MDAQTRFLALSGLLAAGLAASLADELEGFFDVEFAHLQIPRMIRINQTSVVLQTETMSIRKIVEITCIGKDTGSSKTGLYFLVQSDHRLVLTDKTLNLSVRFFGLTAKQIKIVGNAKAVPQNSDFLSTKLLHNLLVRSLCYMPTWCRRIF